MSLYLVQHGKSYSKEEDPEQGLTPAGAEKVRLIAGVAKGYDVQVSRIRHSVKKRAGQTAGIFGEVLSVKDAEEQTGLKPMDDPIAVGDMLHPDEQLMLVGHLPFMERLCAYLVTGEAERPVFKFQNGGIVCLDYYPGTTRWVIKWALMPQIG